MLGAVTATLASCSKSEVVDVNDSQAIGFETFVNKSTRAVTNDEGTVTNKLLDFYVYGGSNESQNLFAGDKVYRSSASDPWKYDNTKYWFKNRTYKFAAISPGAGANLSALLSTLQQQMENGSKGSSASTTEAAAPNLSSLLLALQQGAAQNGTNSAGQAPQGPNLQSLLSTLQGSQSGANAPAISMDTILKIQRTMQALSRSNPNIDLLRAMRPLLSPRRARKVDDAIRIMQLIQLLPALKESGLFALGGDSQ